MSMCARCGTVKLAERPCGKCGCATNAMTRECDYCDGRGWYGEPDHGPDCTPDKCGAPCPVERQVPCPSCAGSGRRL